MKFKYIIMIILLILITSGCSKSLNCTKENKDKEETLKITFVNNKPSTLKWNITFLFSNTDAYIDMSYLEKEQNYSNFDNIEGIKYTLKKQEHKNNIILDVLVDYSIYNNDSIIEIPVIINSLENNKTYLENQGYICK